jgi:EAL domain-containing protein (putative c-di-GMP-specific phosphodiesterase class I)
VTSPDERRGPSIGHVLIVDDDPTIQRAVQRALTREGWATTIVNNGREAVAALAAKSASFDCVVSDVNMPELDGYGMVEALRAKDDGIPVLLITGEPTLEGAVRAIDLGAVSYLAKPFDQETLAAAVARAARRHGVERVRRRAESYSRELFRDDVEARFARALERSWMAFQPIVNVKDRTIHAYEALLRTDEESLRRTDIFIATAERLAKVELLGRTVRAAVAREAVALPAGVNLFVNLHGLELSDEQLYDAKSALAQFAPQVVLEITERTGIDPATGAARVAMLRKLGYRIAVDDLGAGYAALGALATLEPEVVKLDMSLVRDLDQQPRKRRIVAAITAMCRELGSHVVAEGVENRAELAACLDSGIELIQGYLLAKPARGFTQPSFDAL